jgi:electron transport complex protein RnfD
MAKADKTTTSDPTEAKLNVAPSPHVIKAGDTTRRMMIDVIIALVPPMTMAVYLFHQFAIQQLLICTASCLAAEALFVKMRRKALTLNDFSAAVTGIILALSLPATAPWYAGVIASLVAIGIGKIIFGGLGRNIFNPAMVGRAFVMISFAGAMGAAAYQQAGSLVDAVTMATPMDAFKQSGEATPLIDLFWGLTNGSMGETSAAAALLGGLYLCLRRTAAWQIPLGILLATALLAGIGDLAGGFQGTFLLHHLLGGALLFGAFFIATDPVTSPLTPKGKFIFGIGVGCLVMLLRLFSGYPEGLMFAVLLMNAVTPLINRWTRPQTFGEHW